MNFIGIDNGLSGAIVRVDAVGRIVSKQVTPTEKMKSGKTNRTVYDLRSMRELVLNLGREHAAWARGDAGKFKLLVALEKSQPMPASMRGGMGDFSSGYGFGLWCALLAAFNVPHLLVSAATWQHRMLMGVAGTDSKQRSISKARRVQPRENWCATEKSTKPHSGLTDAFWLAEYARLYGTGA